MNYSELKDYWRRASSLPVEATGHRDQLILEVLLEILELLMKDGRRAD